MLVLSQIPFQCLFFNSSPSYVCWMNRKYKDWIILRYYLIYRFFELRAFVITGRAIFRLENEKIIIPVWLGVITPFIRNAIKPRSRKIIRDLNWNKFSDRQLFRFSTGARTADLIVKIYVNKGRKEGGVWKLHNLFETRKQN